ncbi:FliM/FliN family flagellar motor switch protein [bacterium]|nr:FliM/FliN family flagellar motor switch protein [bacterium]MBU1072831.1 FliM/FliN family flagellar motor switch protein [bacterium]MBU1674551.1 FliM/FliN family flagellar motor switch protein [bacterium]
MSDETNTTSAEIDDLLAGDADGSPAGNEGAVFPGASPDRADMSKGFYSGDSFDFSLPQNISRQFEKNLLTLCESFAKSVSLAFTSQLRANTAIRFAKLDLCTYGDFGAGLSDLTAVSIVSLPPLGGYALVHFDLDMMYLMIMRLLGGPIEQVSIERRFTDIELGVGRMITERILSDLRSGAAKLVELNPEFVHLENNPNYLGIIATNDPVVVLNFDICIEDLQGPLRICIPMNAFEPVWDRFDPEEISEYRSAAEVKRDRMMLFEAIKGTTVDVVVKLADISLTFQQILELKEGDTIPLFKSLQSPLELEVQGKPMFRGLPGKLNQNRALKLTERLAEEA